MKVEIFETQNPSSPLYVEEVNPEGNYNDCPEEEAKAIAMHRLKVKGGDFAFVTVSSSKRIKVTSVDSAPNLFGLNPYILQLLRVR